MTSHGGVQIEPLIVRVIQRHNPEWEPPDDLGSKTWTKILCPYHLESNKSASISFSKNAFNCFGCGVKGDAIGIIMSQEGVSYRQAVALAEDISPGSYVQVPRKPPGLRSRKVPWDSGSGDGQPDSTSRDKPVQTGVRSRAPFWT